MPKTKQQKKDEAHWRKVLFELDLHYTQHGSTPQIERETTSSQNDHVVQDGYKRSLKERSDLWKEFLQIPEAFVEHSVAGKFFHQELAERISQEFARRQQDRLDEALPLASGSPRKPRF